MKRKLWSLVIVAAVVGVVLGVGGTLLTQKVFRPGQATGITPRQNGPLVSIGEFTVNLQGGSFLRTSITLEGTDAAAEAVLNAKADFLKDKVNTVLSNKSLADVETPAAREKLRQELLSQLNQVADGYIRNVLFISFIYQ
ncbi:flagellar basal body-associated protein FliL [Peptococcaceae bacterium CEB3]|nr:flagellar basal body-associated protein FliL [Peptococcaceae bacterium CEB3]